MIVQQFSFDKVKQTLECTSTITEPSRIILGVVYIGNDHCCVVYFDHNSLACIKIK